MDKEQGLPGSETPQEEQRNLATVLVNDLNQVGIGVATTAAGLWRQEGCGRVP
jgi:hypothetical protein